MKIVKYLGQSLFLFLLVSIILNQTMSPSLANDQQMEAENLIGDFIVEPADLEAGKDYRLDNGALTILTGKEITISSNGQEIANTIVIKDQVNANVTLKNMNIVTTGTAFDIQGNASAELTLIGENKLKSGKSAGLRVASTSTENAELIITEASTGSLHAIGAFNSAGIGGGYAKSGGIITINGGKITATGHRAGIGGGVYGGGGVITINGGTIIATGNKYSAGINGGAEGNGGQVTINSGIVHATGAGDGAGIGGGSAQDMGTFATGTKGNAFINASSIADNQDTSDWSGIIFDGDQGKVYGEQRLNTNITTPVGKTLRIEADESLTIEPGVVLTNYAFINMKENASINNSGTILNYGVIKGDVMINPPQHLGLEETGDFIVTGGTYGSDYYFSNHSLIIIGEESIQISGKTTQDNIVISDGVNVDITLKDLEIDHSDMSFIKEGICAFDIQGNAFVRITLEGNNSLQSGEHRAGVQVQSQNGKTASLIITQASTGTLKACGGRDGAGIGGGINGSAGNIRIEGGHVDASGLLRGAGIGGGNLGSGGNITISGGSVIAQGGYMAVGIGNAHSIENKGSFSTGLDGNAFIEASSISDTDDTSTWSGIIFQGSKGKVYGNPVLEVDSKVQKEKTLTIEADTILELAHGIVLTIEGTVDNYGALIGSGTIKYSGDGTLNNLSSTSVHFEKNGVVTNSVAYGDVVTLKAVMAQSKIHGLDNKQRARQNTVDFWVDNIGGFGTKIGTAYMVNNVATLEIRIIGDVLPYGLRYGENDIIADFGGGEKGEEGLLPSISEKATLLIKKQLTWSDYGQVFDKVFDGSHLAHVKADPTLNGVFSGDQVTLERGSVCFDDINAGTKKSITAKGFTIGGPDAYKYVAPKEQPPFMDATILKATYRDVVDKQELFYNQNDTDAKEILLVTSFPEDRGKTAYSFENMTDNMKILQGTPLVTNEHLSYTLAGGHAGQMASIQIKAKMQNYEDVLFQVDIILTEKETQEKPRPFDIIFTQNRDDHSFTATIPSIVGAEYSFDGVNFSEINTREDVVPKELIKAYIRMKETDIYNSSELVYDVRTAPTLQAREPVVSPSGGRFTHHQEIAISSPTKGASIYYTTDGTNPTKNSNLYSKPFHISSSATLKAIAIKSNMDDSEVVTAIFRKKRTDKDSNREETRPVLEINGSQKKDEIIFATTKDNIQRVVQDKKGLMFKSEDVNIYFDTESLGGIIKYLQDNVEIRVVKLDALSFENQIRIGSRPVFDVQLISDDREAVTEFADGYVTVSIPYAMRRGENAENLVVYYIDDTGEARVIENSNYDASKKIMVFKTRHFSAFAIGHKATIDASKFSDIHQHWAQEAVEEITRYGLFNGTSETTFSPEMELTRGMFVTVLGRLRGIETARYSQSYFTDIQSEEYFAPYVTWAKAVGIVNEIDDARFAPNQKITREQIAVLLSNYAKVTGNVLPHIYEAKNFNDIDEVSNWAQAAVKNMQMSGILFGKEHNTFDPQVPATRAEVAVVFMRYIERMLSIEDTPTPLDE